MSCHTHITYESSHVASVQPLIAEEKLQSSIQSLRQMTNNDSIPWLVATLDPKTHTLKQTDTGDMQQDKESFYEAFDESRLQYALIQYPVRPAGQVIATRCTKLVLIVWVGDGVPATIKAGVNVHQPSIDRIFGNCHCVIQARHEEDIAKNVLEERVRRAAASAATSV